MLPGTLAGSAGTAFWLSLEEAVGNYDPGLYRYQVDQFIPVPFPGDRLNPASLTVDGGGRVWFIGRDGASLWYYAGP